MIRPSLTALAALAPPVLAAPIQVVEEGGVSVSPFNVGGEFGSSLDWADGMFLAGSPGDDLGGIDSGRATLFESYSDGYGKYWSKVQSFEPADQGTSYASSVAIDGELCAVGVPWYAVGTAGVGAVFVHRRVGGTWQLEQVVVASDGIQGDVFGSAVALDGGTLAVGAPGVDHNGTNSGAAYVFAFDGAGWVEEAKLVPSDVTTGFYDEFGSSVDVDGDRVVVGSPQDDDLGSESGSAYLFRRVAGTWSQAQKLTHPPLSGLYFGDEFGTSVAIDGDRIAIGVPRHDHSGSFGQGAVYVFLELLGTFAFEKKLTASDAGNFDSLGRSVDISDGRVIAGATWGSKEAQGGAAYVFEDTTEYALVPAPGALVEGDAFGTDVSIEGDRAVVTTLPQWTVGGWRAGAAYVFGRVDAGGVQWLELDRVVSDDVGIGDDDFGWDADLSADGRIAVAAPESDLVGEGAGAAYVFLEGVPWQQEETFVPPFPGAGDRFGAAVSLEIDGSQNLNFAAIGAPGDDDQGDAAGAVYLYGGLTSFLWFDEKLYSSTPAPGERLGEAVAVGWPSVFLGAPGAGDAGPDTGAVHVWTRNLLPPPFQLFTWGTPQRLVSPAPAAGGEFGATVEYADGLLVVGEPGADAAHVYTGSAGNWTLQATLTDAQGAPGARFGASITIEGGRVAIGAPNANGGRGRVVLFEQVLGTGPWIETARFQALDGVPGDAFGAAVHLVGDRLSIGAPGVQPAGAVYFRYEDVAGWTHGRRITATDAQDGSRFGARVVGDVATVVASAPDDVDPAVSDGEAFVFWMNTYGTYGKVVLDAPWSSVALQWGINATYELDAGPNFANLLYLVIAGTSGTEPGFTLDVAHAPLNLDPFSLYVLANPNAPPYTNTLGFFDETGTASGTFQIPAGSNPALSGLEIHHLFAVFHFPGPGGAVAVSNVRGVTLF